MSDHRDLLTDLLVERATQGLDESRSEDLATMLTEYPDVGESDFDLAAAALDRFWSHGTAEEMPASVKSRVLEAAPRVVVAPQRDFRSPATGGRWMRGYALAATLVLTFLAIRWAVTTNTDAQGTSPTVIADASDALDLSWAPQGVAGYEKVGGTIEWSTELQRGVMRLTGFPVNDGKKQQYQLWIVDTDRDSNHPVDGGVFDVRAGGVAVIEVDAKLKLLRPAAFAITVEQPGGVVVSAGPHIAVAVVD